MEITHYMVDDHGAMEILETDNKDRAISLADDWIRGGTYEESCRANWWLIALHQLNGIEYDEYEASELDLYHGLEVIAGQYVVLDDSYICYTDIIIDPPVPECSDDEEHDWQRPHNIVGGIEENPGVWGGDGTNIYYREVCANCGVYRLTTHVGSQDNGEFDSVTYEDADEASETWVRKAAPVDQSALVEQIENLQSDKGRLVVVFRQCEHCDVKNDCPHPVIFRDEDGGLCWGDDHYSDPIEEDVTKVLENWDYNCCDGDVIELISE